MAVLMLAGCALQRLPEPSPAPSPNPAPPVIAAPPVAAIPPVSTEPVTPPTPPTPPTQGNKRKPVIVPVLFGTNRIPLARVKGKAQGYGATRGPLVYGQSVVSIPPDRNKGEIPTPPSGFEDYAMFKNPMRYFRLLDANQISEKDIARITANFFKSKPGKRSGLVFVHGYNVAFQAAAFRAAQMSFDMELQSMPVFFSWASKAGTAAYWMDENTALQSVPDFKKFLTTYLGESKIDQVVIVAHSMGSRIVTSALVEMIDRDPKIAKKLLHLVLAAPDLDAAVFKEQVMPVLAGASVPVTVYASSRDRALQTSVKLHGFTRVGSAGKEIVFGDGLETIDASAIDTDFLGHSYFASSPSLIRDIGTLVVEGKRAASRPNLKPRPSELAPHYWQMRP
ncbi:esterase/lipase superfamily enzyme [Variovorax paradoxus]|uniref:alpha/beta hydrolase n=1 Tax=Variovorax atrisoli TaxID=3394203 RepID=UPI0011A5F818|nr:alpha/beta hydrolase [Variovorax paradoxus]MDR6524602.1 esterase/lipase superfamily enzyme [Variovorax paradoxus]